MDATYVGEYSKALLGDPMKAFLFVLLFWTVWNNVSGESGSLPARTPKDMLNTRIRQMYIQISRDLKIGKLTKDQAKSLNAQVETIRNAELADLKANNSKTLTDAQITDLNNQLNTLSKSIPIK
jgi:hypothetical protein